jgi:AAA domain-containing protein
MTDISAHDLILYAPNPETGKIFTDEQMAALAGLSTDEVRIVIDGYPASTRLDIVRELQEIRTTTADERRFEEQVQSDMDRSKTRKEARRREAEERDAHLTSDEGRAAAAAAFEAEFIDLEDIPDPEPLIDGFIYRDTLVRTFGPPKSLKSFVTLDMAAHVSLGHEWHGRRVTQARTLYVVAEGLRGVKKRRDAWNEHHETEMKVQFYPRAVQISDDEEMYRLISYCLVKQIGYVVFDTQARCTVGVEENDNTEMGSIVASLDILKQQTGACVHLVHHSVGSDDTKARGATAWDGAVDAEFRIKRDNNDRTQIKLITKFQKDIGEADDVELHTLEAGKSLVLEGVAGGGTGSAGGGEIAPAIVSDKIAPYLETIRGFGPQPVTITDVERKYKESGGPSRTAIKEAFGKLVMAGAVDQVGTGTSVRITQGGLVFLDGWLRRAPEQPAQTMIE